MRLLNWIFLLTLVLPASQSLAAPVVTHEIEPITGSPKLDTNDMTLVKAGHDQSAQIFDASLRVGIFSGVFDESQTKMIRQFVGLRYDFKKHFAETWQAELKLGNENFIHLMIGKKYWWVLEETTAPYYRFAAGNFLDSSNGLGSIFNFKKFQAIAAIGLDDAFLLNYRVQLELAAGFAIVGPQLEASIGFAF